MAQSGEDGLGIASLGRRVSEATPSQVEGPTTARTITEILGPSQERSV